MVALNPGCLAVAVQDVVEQHLDFAYGACVPDGNLHLVQVGNRMPEDEEFRPSGDWRGHFSSRACRQAGV
jgi:hypothetical protein